MPSSWRVTRHLGKFLWIISQSLNDQPNARDRGWEKLRAPFLGHRVVSSACRIGISACSARLFQPGVGMWVSLRRKSTGDPKLALPKFPRAFAYKYLDKIVRRTAPRLRETHGLAWLRHLKPEEIDWLTIDSYAGVGFESAEFNMSGLDTSEAAAFGPLFSGRHRIAVASAGAGREMIALARSGHEVAGFDPTPALVEAGRTNLRAEGVDALLECVAPNAVPLGWSGFDALVVGRGAYHHLYGRDRRVRFLRACLGLVEPGAPMHLGAVRMLSAGEAAEGLAECYFRRFTPHELEAELAAAGWTEISVACSTTAPHLLTSARRPAVDRAA